MNLIFHELTRLIDDYYKCEDSIIKKQIFDDIQFLTEAYLQIKEYE